MAGDVPVRIAWTLERLALQPTDHLLEIGCGRGATAALICPWLTGGRMTGLDRSAAAIAAAAAANAGWVEQGRLELVEGDFIETRLERRFGQVFAVNVNAFWTRPAAAAPAARTLLTPGGRLLLVYEPPSRPRALGLIEDLPAVLRGGGFGVEGIEHSDGERSLVAVTARAPW